MSDISEDLMGLDELGLPASRGVEQVSTRLERAEAALAYWLPEFEGMNEMEELKAASWEEACNACASIAGDINSFASSRAERCRALGKEGPPK